MILGSCQEDMGLLNFLQVLTTALWYPHRNPEIGKDECVLGRGVIHTCEQGPSADLRTFLCEPQVEGHLSPLSQILFLTHSRVHLTGRSQQS